MPNIRFLILCFLFASFVSNAFAQTLVKKRQSELQALREKAAHFEHHSYRELGSFLRQQKADSLKVDLLCELTFLHQESDSLALALANQALRLSQMIDYTFGEFRSLDVLENIYYNRVKNPEKAAEFYVKSTKVGIKAAQELHAQFRFEDAMLYSKVDSFDYQIIDKLYEKIYKKIPHQATALDTAYLLRKIENLREVSMSFLQSTEYSKARKLLEESLESAKLIDNQTNIAEIYRRLSITYREEGKHRQALEALMQALKLNEISKDEDAVALDYFYLGDFYKNLEKYEEALNYYQQAYQLASKKEKNDLATVIMARIGVTLQNLGQYDKALQYLRKSLDMSHSARSMAVIGTGYYNIGLLYSEMERYDSALFFLNESWTIRQSLKDYKNSAMVLDAIGTLYENQENTDEALKNYEEALRLRKQISDNELMPDSYNKLAGYYFNKQNYAKSVEYAEKALQITQTGNVIRKSKEAVMWLAKGQAALRNYEKAYMYQTQYQAFTDSLRNDDNTKRIAQIEMQYTFQQEQKRQDVEQAEAIRQKQNELDRQRLIGNFFIVGLIIAGILLFFLYQNIRKRKEINTQLEEQNGKVAQQAQDLQVANKHNQEINLALQLERDNLENIVKERTQQIEQGYNNVKLIGEIGQEIIRYVSVDQIVNAVYDNLNTLMNASVFAIALHNAEKATLDYVGAKERGKQLPNFSHDLSSKAHLSVWCFQHKKEVIINDFEKERGYFVPEKPEEKMGEPPESLIYLPLVSSENTVVGVMTVQSFRKHAYTEYHLDILRNIAVYIVIALENAFLYENLEKKVQERTAALQASEEELRQNSEELITTNEFLENTKFQVEKLYEKEKKSKEVVEKMYEKLKNTQTQLVQSEKMASLGQLTAGVAHEINNPINFVYAGTDSLKSLLDDLMKVVDLYAELDSVEFEKQAEVFQKIKKLKKQVYYQDLKEDIYGLVSDIRSGAERTAEIVKSLRTFSRLDETEIKSADLHENIDSTLVILHNQYRNKVLMHKQYSSEYLYIECYPGQLNQVFMNIISNAIQAIDQQGEIFIETEKLSLSEFDVRISIRDTGAGMSEEVRKRIFEPFFTTKEIGKGTGLGLSITHGIIEKHKGKIEVESEIGKGTAFHIYLPDLKRFQQNENQN